MRIFVAFVITTAAAIGLGGCFWTTSRQWCQSQRRRLS